MPDVSETTLLFLSPVIPTYHERENIGLLIKRVHGLLRDAKRSFEIIVVDDDSPDRTWEAAEALLYESGSV